MIVEKYWVVTLKNSIFKGLRPAKDPFDDTVFYIGDGWGSTYPSMKFRKLYIANGVEMANFPIKNSSRCFYTNITGVFVASDKKIYQLDRKDLSIQKTFEKNVPRYTDYINSNDIDCLLLMNHSGDFIYNYNYNTEKLAKKKIKSCTGIIKSNGNNFLIFSKYEGIYNYNLANNNVKKLLGMEPYYKCILNKHGELFVHCGKIIEKTYNTYEYIKPLSKIKVYKSIMDNIYDEIDVKIDFTDLIVSEEEGALYLINKNIIYIYSIDDKKIIDKYTFNEEILTIFIKEKIIFTYEFDKAKPNILMSWKYK
ncbi:MAG: hypothetical protein LBJ63_07405 [Prevotellaceae bacterium]|jgi:hypothetical protein|nr:hypothetical protein [Prevotellaceae bacterium]